MAFSTYKPLLVLLMFTCWHHKNSYAHQAPSAETANDSAAHCMDEGQVNKARQWIAQALKTPATPPSRQLARAYFLLGDLEENEGFTSEALVVYRKSVANAARSAAPVWWAFSLTGMASALTTLGLYNHYPTYASSISKCRKWTASKRFALCARNSRV